MVVRTQGAAGSAANARARDRLSRRGVLAGAGLLAARPAVAAPAMKAVLDYVGGQNTTGFLVVRDRAVLVEKNWPLSPTPAARAFRASFVYGETREGALLEDVASQQKSIVGLLAAIAVDKALLDVDAPVSSYLMPGWSQASLKQEGEIKVIHLLNMSSGLDEHLGYRTEPGGGFFYNTPAYALVIRILAAVADMPIDVITRDWLTDPAGMAETGWRPRPAAFAGSGNAIGLVTCPRDLAKFGQLVLDRGRAANGTRVVTEAQLDAMFARSPTNPAYGRLWWLNGGEYAINPAGERSVGPMIPTAPNDLVLALGFLDRKLYIVPSRKLLVVRLGQAVIDKDFDNQLWSRLSRALRL